MTLHEPILTVLSMGIPGTNLSAIWIGTQNISFTKMLLKILATEFWTILMTNNPSLHAIQGQPIKISNLTHSVLNKVLIDKLILVQVMGWCCQAPSHDLNQCWHSPIMSYSITRSQWVKIYIAKLKKNTTSIVSVWHFPILVTYKATLNDTKS